MQAAGSEVREDLRLEHGIEPCNRLHLDDDGGFYGEVDPVLSDGAPSVRDANDQLSVERDSLSAEFECERLLVRALAEAGSEHAVDVNGAPDNPLRELVVRNHAASTSNRHATTHFPCKSGESRSPCGHPRSF
jgi:hypothetical protein